MSNKRDKIKRVVADFLSGKASDTDKPVKKVVDEDFKAKLKSHIGLKHAFIDRFEELDRIAEKIYQISPISEESHNDSGSRTRFMKAAFSEDLFKTLKPKEKRMLKSINSSVIEKFLSEED